MRIRTSLLAAAAALVGLTAAPLVASAGQFQFVPTSQHALSHATAFGGSANTLSLNQNSAELGNFGPSRGGQVLVAPTSQTARASSFAVFGDATSAAVNSNSLSLGNVGSRHQTIIAPTTQTAVANSVAIGGNASSVAVNSNDVSGLNARR
jgi:hypothetical protein